VVRRIVVVAAVGTTQTLAWGSSYYLPAILAEPIAEGLGLSRTMVFGVFSGSLLLSALLGPAVGRAIDNRGGRGVLVLSNVVLAAGLVLLAVAQGGIGLAVAWAAAGCGHGIGPLRCRLRRARRFLRAGGTRANHGNYPRCRVREHDRLAALSFSRRKLGLARHLPNLGGASSADRSSAQPLSHSACPPPERAVEPYETGETRRLARAGRISRFDFTAWLKMKSVFTMGYRRPCEGGARSLPLA
jgi:hypothetical protein